MTKRFWIPVDVTLFDSWTTNFQTNLFNNARIHCNNNLQPISINIMQIRDFAQSVTNESVYFHFIKKDGKISIALESKNAQGVQIFKGIDTQGNLINLNEQDFITAQSNYLNNVLPFLEIYSGIVQTRYTVCNALEMYSCIQNTPIQNTTIGLFYFAQVGQYETIDQNVKHLINNSNKKITFILRFTDNNGNILSFDANHTYPPDIL